MESAPLNTHAPVRAPDKTVHIPLFWVIDFYKIGEAQFQHEEHTTGRGIMFTVMRKRIVVWWKLRLLEGSYPPLLEQAKREKNFERALLIEEKFWFEKACLLEEHLLATQGRTPLPQKFHPFTTPYPFRQSPHREESQPPPLPRGAMPSIDLWWIIPLSVLGGALTGAAVTHSLQHFF